MARLLMDRGFTLVRPLAGGLDAWVEKGFDVDAYDLVAHRDPASSNGDPPDRSESGQLTRS